MKNNPSNPMPDTKAKLMSLIEQLRRAEPSETVRAALSLSERLLELLEVSILIHISRDSDHWRLLNSLDNSPHYEGWHGGFVVNNAGYAPLVDALIKKFGGNLS